MPYTPPHSPPHTPPRSVLLWLLIVYAMIGAMVVIGGITRLTGSGLSMVDWHPLMGALPPLDEPSWQAVFLRYQQSPQYAQVNEWMTLGDFKQIFFWEYLHRLFGRTIGLVFFVPWLVFVVRRQLRGRIARRAGGAFVLGGAQGLLGWFMVKSGLVDMPEVSHFRLAAHLGLAFFLACWVQWLWMDLAWSQPSAVESASPSEKAGNPGLKTLSQLSTRRFTVAIWSLISLISLQIVYGAFMAGKRAGLLYATFPDMNGQWLPGGWRSDGGLLHDLINNPIAIHLSHRTLAWFALVLTLLVARQGWIRSDTARQRTLSVALAVVVIIQVGLGAATVMTHVAIPIATLHQGLALIYISIALAVAHQFREKG